MSESYYFSTSPAEEYVHIATKCCVRDATDVISTRPVFTSATKKCQIFNIQFNLDFR